MYIHMHAQHVVAGRQARYVLLEPSQDTLSRVEQSIALTWDMHLKLDRRIDTHNQA